MWAQIVNILIGLGVIIAPAIFGFEKTGADNNYIVGPLIVTFAIIAIWEVNRNVRWFNYLTGLWLFASPFVIGFTSTARTLDIVAGIAIIIFSSFKGTIKSKYGGGWRSLLQKQPLHVQQLNKPSK